MRLRSLFALGLLVSTPVQARGVLVFVLDDLGADKVGAYADERYGSTTPTYLPDTPTMDGLADIGLRFTNVWANPVCSPTRASILTGRYAYQHDIGQIVLSNTPELSTGETTLPEVLADAASTPTAVTSGAFGKWHLGTTSAGGTNWTVAGSYADAANPLRHGFASFDGFLAGSVADYTAWTRVQSSGQSGTVATSNTWTPDATLDATADFVAGQAGDWFAWVAINAPHTDEADGESSWESNDLPADVACPDLDGDGACGQSEIYAGLVAAADGRIAEVLADLAATDPALLEDTTILVLGDNGTPSSVLEAPFLASGERTSAGKATVYESGVRVPLVIARGCDWMDQADGSFDGLYDGVEVACQGATEDMVTPGLAVSAPVQVQDVFATVSELAGSSYAAPSSSASLVPCFSATSANASTCGSSAFDSRRQYTEYFKRPYTSATTYGTTGVASSGEAALKRGNHKIVARITGTGSRACVKWEMYDLSTDPYETDDLRAGGSTMTTAQSTAFNALRTYLRTTLAPDWLPTKNCS